MPGLTTLRDGATEIDIQLEQLDDGARLVYTTDDPRLVEALHQWAEAQVSDRGDHAKHGNYRSPSTGPPRAAYVCSVVTSDRGEGQYVRFFDIAVGID